MRQFPRAVWGAAAGTGAALLALCAAPAFAGEASGTVAVQAVLPIDGGKARVIECSGTLFEKDLVLTAGHCLDGIDRPEHVAVFRYEGSEPKAPPLGAAAIARHPDHVVGWRQRDGDPATRQREIAADLALIRLAPPGAAPADDVLLATGPAALPAGASAFEGAGAASAGGRSGRLKRGGLSAARLSTGGGPVVAFATASATVCGGDSGGPVGSGRSVWGVVVAVLQAKGGCGSRIVIAPVDAGSAGFRAMRAAVGAP